MYLQVLANNVVHYSIETVRCVLIMGNFRMCTNLSITLFFLCFQIGAGQGYGMTTPYFWRHAGDIRLVGGSTPNEGRIEVYYGGQWSTVCDDNWDDVDASVVCRQLGYAGPTTAYNGGYFGEGDGLILLDDVDCSGWEPTLLQCPNRGMWVHDCQHAEDAGVRCTSNDYGMTTPYFWRHDGDIRLVGGSTSNEGRIEVYYGGQWGTVCDDAWDDVDASVVCRQLGYTGPTTAFNGGSFGEGDGLILLDEVDCQGWESTLLACPNQGMWVHNCQHSEDAGVRCTSNGDVYGEVRLVGGEVPTEGRVEIFYNDEWGTICDDYWYQEDADVICRQLGYDGVEEFYDQAYFGEGSGPIMRQLYCDGSESHWLQCSYSEWNTYSCGHSEDVGVTCTSNSGEGLVRLRDGFSENSGRVELYNSGEWGTVCDDLWSYYDALVICRQLGYIGVESDRGQFGYGSGPIMRDLGCEGDEWFWKDCSFTDWGTSSCSHNEDAAVTCTVSATFDDGSIRLVGDNSEHSGRVEIYHYSEWGTVCDDGWNIVEADVVCRQIGFPGAFTYETNAYFGQGTGSIMLDDVNCDGDEHMLTQCNHNGWYDHNCNHDEDVGVRCDISVIYYPRLVDGNSWYEGRVELWDGYRWTRMCDESVYEDVASTICKQIGFSDYEEIYIDNPFGYGNAPPSDVAFECGSNSRELADCYTYGIADPMYCGNVAVRCEYRETLSGGAITGIVLLSVFVCVCIGSCISLSYRSSKWNRGKSRTRPTVAVISGADNLAGPPASQLNQNNGVAQPPTYNEVLNNPGYYPQHVGVVPTMPTAYLPVANPETFSTLQAPPVHPPPKPDVFYPYPVETTPGSTHGPQYPIQPNHPPHSFHSVTMQQLPQNQDTLQSNEIIPTVIEPGYATIIPTNPQLARNPDQSTC